MQAVNLPLGGSWRAIRPLCQVQSKRLRTRTRGERECCPPEHLALGPRRATLNPRALPNQSRRVAGGGPARARGSGQIWIAG